MKPALGIIAVVALAAGSPAQAGTNGESAIAALHRGWIAETLDLDRAAATELYLEVAKQPRAATPERWVAIARLAELRRLGADVGAPLDLEGAPQALRQEWAAGLPPLATDELIRQLRADPDAAVGSIAGRTQDPLVLRPLVPVAETWLLAQTGPSLRDRRRQRMQASVNLRRSPEAIAYLERLYASTIVSAEVNGRRSQADALRELYFTTWQPPQVVGDPATLIARARDRLTEWAAEPSTTAGQRAVLTMLRDHVASRAATDPREVLGLLLRLPRYAERLLAEPAGGR